MSVETYVQVKLSTIDVATDAAYILQSYDGLADGPEVVDNDIVVKGITGAIHKKPVYGTGEVSLEILMDGDYNTDGTPYEGDAGEHAAQLYRDLVRATNGDFPIEVTHADGKTWTCTGWRNSKISAKHQTFPAVRTASLTVKLTDPFWVEKNALIDILVQDTGGLYKVISELNHLEVPIDDADLIINGSDIYVEDRNSGSWFRYEGSTDGDLTIKCGKRFRPLDGQGRFTALTWGGSVPVFTIGDGRRTPAIRVDGGTLTIRAARKILTGN